jgi:ribosomal protein S18 acetylase RimI-like enzyme
MGEIKVREKTPTFEEYYSIVEKLGWLKTVNVESYRDAADDTLFGVVAYDGDLPVGMGRVVGSGMYYYVQDLAVIPGYQKSGTGKKLMQKIMKYLEKTVPEKTFVSVFAPKNTRDFFREFGFEADIGFIGLFKLIKP